MRDSGKAAKHTGKEPVAIPQAKSTRAITKKVGGTGKAHVDAQMAKCSKASTLTASIKLAWCITGQRDTRS